MRLDGGGPPNSIGYMTHARIPRTPSSAVLIALLAVAGCSDPVGSAADRSTLSVRYAAVGPLATPGAVTVQLSEGAWSTTVGSTSFQPGGGVWFTDPVPIASPGRLTVRVSLLAGRDTVASGYFAFDVQRRYQYGLGVYVGSGDPRRFPWVICVPEVFSLPTRSSAEAGADSVYVTWGGLPRDAVC